MKNTLSPRVLRPLLILALTGVAFSQLNLTASQAPPAQAQQPPQAGAPPAAPPGGGGGRGGGRGGGLPGATPEQTAAVQAMNTALADQNAAVTAARTELAVATFADVKNVAGITAAVEKLRAAELALATKRADEFAKLQASPNKLNPEQVTALIAAGGNVGGGGRGGGRGGV